MNTQPITSGAEFSECRQYRYLLWRVWDPELPSVVFIGLNPSKADETADDATIRKCCGFARRWGFGGIRMVNLYAFVATDPKELWKADCPTGGMRNYETIAIESRMAELMVAAWGSVGQSKYAGKLEDQAAFVAGFVRHQGLQLMCLGKTKGGFPRHPSRLAYATRLESFESKG